MTDKKSVVVTMPNGNTIRFREDADVSYAFEIGEHNGCLVILEKKAANTGGVITVPDTEEVLKVFAAHTWGAVKSV